MCCGLEKMSLKRQWRRCEVEKKSSLKWCLRRVGKREESESVSGFITAVTVKCYVLFCCRANFGTRFFYLYGLGNRGDKRETEIKRMSSCGAC